MSLKVVHLGNSDLGGGAAKASYRIHRGLRDLGVSSTMLVANKMSTDPDVVGPSSSLHKIWVKAAPKIDALPRKLFTTPNRSLISPAWIGSGMLRKMHDLSPDLVQLHWICGGFLRIEALGKIQKPIVWRLADMWAFSGGEHYVQGSERYKEKYLPANRPQGETGFDLNRWIWNRKLRAWRAIKDLTIVTPSKWLARCVSESALFEIEKLSSCRLGRIQNDITLLIR